MKSKILGNGVVVTGGAKPRVIDRGAVVFAGERIVAAGPEEELRRQYPDAEGLDARGGLILPGFVNLHHHFYSSLARGLDPGSRLRNFVEVLDRLWWRLDRALDTETIKISAELAAAECIRWGTTTVFDHHASPGKLGGSLDLVAEAIEKAGLSAILCYEITDRNGHDEALSGLKENLRFLRERREDPRIRGMVGLHASFTLRDATLAEVAERRPKGVGCHIHVAEDAVDIQASREIFGQGPIQRLERYGLLDRLCLVAHGIHLGPQSYETLAHYRTTIVHNPESNANNGVGRLDVGEATRRGCRVGLGTDGMAASMLRSLKSTFLLERHAHRDPSAGFEHFPDLLENNAATARRFFDEPHLGELVPGAPADIVVVDAPPPTPIDDSNLFAHLVYGASEAPVRHTIARGQILLRDFEHQVLDPAEIAERARERAPELWERFRSLGWGTSFLGEKMRSDQHKPGSPSAR